MSVKNRAALFSLITLLVMLISLAAPAIASADDASPPPETTSETEITIEETPPSEPTAETVSIPEILEQAPEGTELVVLDEAGEAVPLASEEAAEVIATGDPMWCPEVDGVQTLPGEEGCTDPFTGFNPNINDGGLLAELSGGSYTGNGTIYVATDYDSSLDGSSVDFISGDYSLEDLTIQGGWNFVSNTVTGTSLFDGTSLYFSWEHKLTLNNLEIKDAPSDGLRIESSDDVSLNNVDVDNSALVQGWDGIYIEADGDASMNHVNSTNNNNGTGAVVFADSIDIQNSNFDSNYAYGLLAEDSSPVTITLNNVTADDNGLGGALLFSDGTIIVTNSQFNGNGGDAELDCEDDCDCDIFCFQEFTEGLGLFAANSLLGFGDPESGSIITLNNVTANENSLGGAYLFAEGDISVSDSDFINNGYAAEPFCSLEDFGELCLLIIPGMGLVAANFLFEQPEVPTAITLNNVIANTNALGGAALLSVGSIEVTDSQFIGNGAAAQLDCDFESEAGFCLYGDEFFPLLLPAANGLWAFGGLAGGEIVLNQVQTLNNYGHGTVLFGDEIIVLGSTFDGNGEIGVENLQEVCGESLECYEFFDVALGEGVFLWADGLFVSHLELSSVTVECSQAHENSGAGFEIYTGEIVLSGVTASGNGEDFKLFGEDSVNIFSIPCGPGGGDEPDDPGLNIVPVSGGERVGLDCASYIGTVLLLANGDHAVLPCPIQDIGILNANGAEDLPGEVGEDYEFSSGLTLQVMLEGGNADVIQDGFATIAFTLPSGVDAEDLAILWWNGSEWVPLNEVSGDGRVVNNDGFVTEDGFFAAILNFTGTFILVQK